MRALIGLTSLLLVVGCTTAVPATPPPTPTTPTPTATPAGTPVTPTATPSPTASPSPTGAATSTAIVLPTDPPTDVLPPDILQTLINDAAARAGAAAEAVTIVRADAVTWRDSSLGCPEPGTMYLPVLTEGFWVVLEVAGTEYDFRGTTDRFILCEIPEQDRQPPIDG
ncbi:MAG: hypothetical protein M3N29_04415 [Chloroflexota bacterium]|nr:hypothetical protein [Chloroflexota bacterium]